MKFYNLNPILSLYKGTSISHNTEGLFLRNMIIFLKFYFNFACGKSRGDFYKTLIFSLF